MFPLYLRNASLHKPKYNVKFQIVNFLVTMKSRSASHILVQPTRHLLQTEIGRQMNQITRNNPLNLKPPLRILFKNNNSSTENVMQCNRRTIGSKNCWKPPRTQFLRNCSNLRCKAKHWILMTIQQPPLPYFRFLNIISHCMWSFRQPPKRHL